MGGVAGLRGVIGGLLRGAGLEALSLASILLEGVSENRRVPLVDDVDKPGVAGLGFDSSGENPGREKTTMDPRSEIETPRLATNASPAELTSMFQNGAAPGFLAFASRLKRSVEPTTAW